MHGESELAWRMRRSDAESQPRPIVSPPTYSVPRQGTRGSNRVIQPVPERSREPAGRRGSRLALLLAPAGAAALVVVVALAGAPRGAVLPAIDRPADTPSASESVAVAQASSPAPPSPTPRQDAPGRGGQRATGTGSGGGSGGGPANDRGTPRPTRTAPVATRTRPPVAPVTPAPQRGAPATGATVPVPPVTPPPQRGAPATPATTPVATPRGTPATPMPTARPTPTPAPSRPPAPTASPVSQPSSPPPNPTPVPTSGERQPVAAFGVRVDGLEARFSNRSRGGNSWTWSLGDGTSSTARNPNHVYTAPGSYTVTLEVRGDDGATATHSETITIGV